ncbi:DUF4435 domain-containing protein [Flavobacterium facile]|jgi:hypothetical protein|uniref:DUF4435 domain-containing protein n=1 Tax=Flavobacterium facile TaxID=2893174 RepID=UPI002E7A828D|nr:DUF4435 domain-containing protein [Flavobacterium sp. T-12]
MSLGVEQMRNSTMEPVVAYTEFMNSTAKLTNHLFCFFEGKDNPYYVPRIKKHTTDFHPIKCGGRSKVLEVHNLIKNQAVYNKYKKAFFIDKDFNETLSLQNPPVFETACYSIENLYVSQSVFKEILSNEFHLSETTNTLFEKYSKLYKERQDEFHSAVLLFNAWYACLIDIRNSDGIKTGVQLADKMDRGLIQISIDEVAQNYSIQDLKDKYPNASEIDGEVLNQKIEEFKNCDVSKMFRGKYEMEFLIKFIDCMLAESRLNRESITFPFASPLTNQQAISIFSNYAETPETLDDYLKEVVA